MARLSKTEKQSWEAYYVYANFAENMVDGETIDTIVSVVAVDANGDDATSTLIESSTEQVIPAEPHRVYFRIQNGEEALSEYKTTTKIVTSTGNKWEVDGLVKIKEL